MRETAQPCPIDERTINFLPYMVCIPLIPPHKSRSCIRQIRELTMVDHIQKLPHPHLIRTIVQRPRVLLRGKKSYYNHREGTMGDTSEHMRSTYYEC